MKLQLLRRRTTQPRFRWDTHTENAVCLLIASYMAEVEHRNRKFVEDENVINNIEKVAEFLTDKTNNKFGLMLCGTCGNGKTTLIRAIQGVTNILVEGGLICNCNGLAIHDARELVRLAVLAEQDSKAREKWEQVKRKQVIALEDIGREPTEVLSYGNAISPIVELLEFRYSEQLTTFITTNLTAKEIREKYGTRIADRLNEMMQVIIFKNGTYRK